MLSSASDRAKLFTKDFSKDSNLDDSGISLTAFASRNNLKLHNISKMIKKIIISRDLSKTSGPDFIPLVLLKNCELELLKILANSSICVRKSCFPDGWKVLLMVPVFTLLGPCIYPVHPVSLLFVVKSLLETCK